MNNSKRIVAMLGFAFVLAIGALAGHNANAATAIVSLASAPTAAPIAAVPTGAPAAVADTQDLPRTSTGDPSDQLTVLGVALVALGVLLLRGRPIPHL